jgi:hypothetical protein
VLSVRASNHWQPHKHDYGKQSSFWPAKVVETTIITLILVDITLVIIDSVEWGHTEHATSDAKQYYPAAWGSFFGLFQYFSTAIFTLEYLMRLWSCVEDPNYDRFSPCRGRLAWALKPLSLLGESVASVASVLNHIAEADLSLSTLSSLTRSNRARSVLPRHIGTGAAVE